MENGDCFLERIRSIFDGQILYEMIGDKKSVRLEKKNEKNPVKEKPFGLLYSKLFTVICLQFFYTRKLSSLIFIKKSLDQISRTKGLFIKGFTSFFACLMSSSENLFLNNVNKMRLLIRLSSCQCPVCFILAVRCFRFGFIFCERNQI